MKRLHFWLALFLLSFMLSCADDASTPPIDDGDTAVSTPEPIAPTAEPEPTETAVVETTPPYLDPSLPIAERVDDLLARMTLEEKIGQMTLIEKGSATPQMVTELGLGAILSGGGGYPSENTPEAWLDMVTTYQQAALETRLGIPLLYGVDAVHGHNNLEGATIFPHNSGLGATRNPALVEEIGRVTAVETLATGIHWNYAPVLAVARDIRWGRAYEAYGEDTALVTEMGNALMLGLQGTDGVTDLNDPLTMLATPKHWVADGGAQWGTSTTGSYQIDQGDAIIDEATLRSVHVTPYITTIENGSQSVMISYSSWNGLKMHANGYLINDVLKEELGFPGFVVSDWQAIDQIDSDFDRAVATAVNAGIDMNMVPFDARSFISAVENGIANGDISEARIDEAVRRILTVKMQLGLFERPIQDASLLNQIGSEEHRALARQAVSESLVLLKNENDALPLDPSTPRILVAGQFADNIGLQSGGWTIEWQGGDGNITEGTTILEGIEAAVSADTEIIHDRFGRFNQLEDQPEKAEVGIVVLGERPYAEGRGDSDDLTINDGMLTRMNNFAETVIVIIVSGRPLVITEQLPLADAWVMAWLPGSEGGGVADVLFGESDFVGKLPFSWPRSNDQLPFDFENMPTSGCEAPLFPYGYGLTYAETAVVEPLDC